MLRPKMWGYFYLPVVVLVLTSLVGCSTSPAVLSELAEATPENYAARSLQLYTRMLAEKNLSKEDRNSIETKVAMYSSITTQMAGITEPPKITPYATGAPLVAEPYPTGLAERGTSDFHPSVAVINTIWNQDVRDGQEHITIYAGELGSGTKYPGRGVVFVIRVNAISRKGTTDEYPLPEGTGSVKISDVKGDYVILTSGEGKTFYFYIPGQQFVESLEKLAVTVTTLPTRGPRPTLGPEPISPYPKP